VCSLFDVTCLGSSTRPCWQRFATVNVTCFSLNSQPHQDKSGPNRFFTWFKKRMNPCTGNCFSDILRRDAVAIRPRSSNSSLKKHRQIVFVNYKDQVQDMFHSQKYEKVSLMGYLRTAHRVYQSLVPTALSSAMQEENAPLSSCLSRSNSMTVHYTFGRAKCYSCGKIGISTDD
jgi:hypothetical protein